MAKILVVDDEPVNRLLLKTLLPSHDVIEAESGEEALELLATSQPDLVVLDLTLPGINGIECLKRVRESGSSTRVLLHTATTADETMRDVARFLRAGFLPKPCEPQEAIAIIERALGAT